jgi:hypothetical protein
MNSESTRQSASGWYGRRATACHPLLSTRPPARRPYRLALLAAVALMGGAVTPALAQAPLTEDGGWVLRDDSRLRTSEPDARTPRSFERDARPRRSFEPLAPDTGTRPGMRSWQAWPESLATWPRGDWPPAEGLPLPGPDGSACWPHGDHVHCR